MTTHTRRTVGVGLLLAGALLSRTRELPQTRPDGDAAQTVVPPAAPTRAGGSHPA